MTIFVNYYQQKTKAIRGGSVYASMLAQHLQSPDVNVFEASWKKRLFIPGLLNKYISFPYRRLAKLNCSALMHMPGPFNPSCLTFKGKVITTFHDQVNYDFYTQPTTQPATQPTTQPTKGQILLRQLEAITAAKTEYAITPSQFSADRLTARFPKFIGKTHVVYPGIEDIFFEVRSQPECDRTLKELRIQQSPFLLFVGAISPHKNYQSVVATYARLRQTYPKMKLVMIGAIRGRREFASLLQDLRQRQLSLNIDVIIPMRRVSNLELSVLYQMASIFLFPSFYEGWGIAVGEALASGTPAVISDIPVFRECFAGGALMVNPHRVEDIVAGVVTLLNRPGLRDSYRQQGRSLVKARRWNNVAVDTINVYRCCACAKQVYPV